MSQLESELTQRELIPTTIYDSADAACAYVAGEIAALINERNAAGKATVLGLATGSTPVRLYRELIRMHKEDGLSFANVVTFNLDEYSGLTGDHPESYRKFMQDQLFDHVDLKPENTNVPDGTVERDAVEASCQAYEDAIAAAGGIDIQILGIGRTGHIGFNEPGSGPETLTREVTLDRITIKDAARDFLGEENVPRHAITMGVGTILAARKVFLLAWGEGKASIIARTVEGETTDHIPATFLQNHDQCTFCIDSSAASQLTRLSLPWLVSSIDWTPEVTRKAVLWLAQKTGKSIQSLSEDDYQANGMADLLAAQGSADSVNETIFALTSATIAAAEANSGKRSLILSPEPSDDAYSIGGTLSKLQQSGSDVTIAYQTSGNLAVPDPDVRRAAELAIEIGDSSGFAQSVEAQLDEKGRFGADTADIRKLKGLLRRGEARAAARTLGIDSAKLHFLDLPFYETGRYRRFVATEADVKAVQELLEKVQPEQIFATGYGNDPLSVHAISFDTLLKALEACQGSAWAKNCTIWLYRDPAQEWESYEIDMAIPLDIDAFEAKLQAIYEHQTQRSQTPGANNLWDTAGATNTATAATYHALGLPKHEAIECFKRYQ